MGARACMRMMLVTWKRPSLGNVRMSKLLRRAMLMSLKQENIAAGAWMRPRCVMAICLMPLDPTLPYAPRKRRFLCCGTAVLLQHSTPTRQLNMPWRWLWRCGSLLPWCHAVYTQPNSQNGGFQMVNGCGHTMNLDYLQGMSTFIRRSELDFEGKCTVLYMTAEDVLNACKENGGSR